MAVELLGETKVFDLAPIVMDLEKSVSLPDNNEEPVTGEYKGLSTALQAYRTGVQALEAHLNAVERKITEQEPSSNQGLLLLNFEQIKSYYQSLQVILTRIERHFGID